MRLEMLSFPCGRDRNEDTVTQMLSSVRYALKILSLLERKPLLGVTEIARELDVSSSSAHRLLATMQEERFVRQVLPGRKYRLGPAMEGSRNSSAVEDFVELGAPRMVELRRQTDETVHIALLRGIDTHFVAAVESERMMRVASRVGQRLAAHTTAAGKLLLSLNSDDEVRTLYADRPLTSPTADSIATIDGLISALAEIRLVGFARNMVESEAGVAALAVPLHSADGTVECSLTLTGPDSRFNPDGSTGLSAREDELLALLREAAFEIESTVAKAGHPRAG